jgi:hypothetical protein
MKISIGKIVVIWPYYYAEPIYGTIVKKQSFNTFEVFADGKTFECYSSQIFKNVKVARKTSLDAVLTQNLSKGIQEEMDAVILSELQKAFKKK